MLVTVDWSHFIFSSPQKKVVNVVVVCNFCPNQMHEYYVFHSCPNDLRVVFLMRHHCSHHLF